MLLPGRDRLLPGTGASYSRKIADATASPVMTVR